MNLNLRSWLRSLRGEAPPPLLDALEDAFASGQFDATYDMADEHIDPSDYEAEQLRSFEDAGITKVRILSERDAAVCPACQAADGAVMTVAEAKRTSALPHATCTNTPCRCTYLPILDD